MYYNLSQNPVYHENDNMVNDSSSMSYFNQNMDNTNCFALAQNYYYPWYYLLLVA